MKALTKQSDVNQPKVDVRGKLDELENKLAELKIQFEQYFSGILNLPPDKLHEDVRRRIKFLIKAPFKNSALNYRLRSLEGRYHALNTYWQRVLKQREDGTYSRDVFKANLREKQATEEAFSATKAGKAEKSMHNLFDSYRSAIEQQSGNKVSIDYNAFQKSLLQRANDFKTKTGVEKVSFKVTVKDGKVSVQIKAKKEKSDNPS